MASWDQLSGITQRHFWTCTPQNINQSPGLKSAQPSSIITSLIDNEAVSHELHNAKEKNAIVILTERNINTGSAVYIIRKIKLNFHFAQVLAQAKEFVHLASSSPRGQEETRAAALTIQYRNQHLFFILLNTLEFLEMTKKKERNFFKVSL